MATFTDFWGPRKGIDSKDYVLYMEGRDGPTSEPQRLLAHSLTSPNQNLTDALTNTTVKLQNGRVVPYTYVKRAAVETSRTYTVGFPSGALWTPAMEFALRAGCTKDFYLVFLCPEDRQYRHWVALPDATLNPPIEAEDIITTGEDTNMVTMTSELQTPQQVRGFELGTEIVYDVGGTVKSNAIAFLTQDCAGCDYQPGLAVITVGGDGTAIPSVIISEDRFATVSTSTVGTAADRAKAIYSNGDTLVLAVYTGATFAAATVGEVQVSQDRGSTWTEITGLVDVIAGIAGNESTVFAFGKNADGDAVLHMSTNAGASWTASTSTVLPTGSALMGGAWDNEQGRLYLVGEGGTLLVGRIVGSNLTLTDISANLPGTPGDLLAVAVLGENNILVGGAAGYAAESRDGGVTWETVIVSGTTAITAIAGNKHRAMVGAGSNLYERTVMTKNAFKKVTLELGQTLSGTITSLVMGPEGNFNLFAGTTDAGEQFLSKPFYPGA